MPKTANLCGPNHSLSVGYLTEGMDDYVLYYVYKFVIFLYRPEFSLFVGDLTEDVDDYVLYYELVIFLYRPEFSLFVGDLTEDVDDYVLYYEFAKRYRSCRSAKGKIQKVPKCHCVELKMYVIFCQWRVIWLSIDCALNSEFRLRIHLFCSLDDLWTDEILTGSGISISPLVIDFTGII